MVKYARQVSLTLWENAQEGHLGATDLTGLFASFVYKLADIAVLPCLKYFLFFLTA